MATLQSGYQPKRSLDSNDTHARKKGEPPIHRGLQLSELEAPTPHFAALDKKDALKGGDSGPLETPGGAGTDDGCRFGVVSEFGRRIDADHLLGTCARCSMSKEQAQTVLASSSAADYKNFDLFLQVCLDASSDVEKLLTDRLSAGAEM